MSAAGMMASVVVDESKQNAQYEGAREGPGTSYAGQAESYIVWFVKLCCHHSRLFVSCSLRALVPELLMISSHPPGSIPGPRPIARPHALLPPGFPDLHGPEAELGDHGKLAVTGAPERFAPPPFILARHLKCSISYIASAFGLRI